MSHHRQAENPSATETAGLEDRPSLSPSPSSRTAWLLRWRVGERKTIYLCALVLEAKRRPRYRVKESLAPMELAPADIEDRHPARFEFVLDMARRSDEAL